MQKKPILLLLLLALSFYPFAQKYNPHPDNLKARDWFQDAKFGLFVHWGVYSVLADGEWVMNTRKISKADYEKLPPYFNPSLFDAKEWVTMAKQAGMQYITITSKHHDGFAMYDSKLTDWDIVDRSPYKKDPLKLLADECHRQGMKLFFYHSHLDWYQNNYYPRGQTGHSAGRPNTGDWDKYLDFVDGQLTELLSNYGKIDGIWFDGWWDKKEANWRLEKTYQLIHQLQPHCLVGNNHHMPPFEGEDFQMFEKDLPGGNTSGFNDKTAIGQLPLETCETMNNAWGYNLTDNKYKSPKALIQYLVKAAGNNANFLLNVGPMPNGKIQKEFVDNLAEVGQWLSKYGQSIYGTRGGKLSPKAWGVTTQKENKVYIHVLNPESKSILLDTFTDKVKTISLLGSSEPILYEQTKHGLIVQLPVQLNDIDTILVVETLK
jgi:alpha-L-fucosidase